MLLRTFLSLPGGPLGVEYLAGSNPVIVEDVLKLQLS